MTPLLIQSMVALGPGVWWVQNAAGDRKFVSAVPIDGSGWTPIAGVPQPVVTSTELFTVSTPEAVKLGLTHGTANDVNQLLADRHLTLLATLAPSASDQILTWLASLHIRLILLVMFLLSIYVAIHVPGHGAAEACATVTLGLLLFAPWMTGYGQTWEIFAIVGGIGLVLFELFVIPGHGIAAIPGAALAIFGLVMTFVPKEPSGLPGTLPSLNGTWVDVQHGVGNCRGRAGDQHAAGRLVAAIFAGGAILQSAYPLARVGSRDGNRRGGRPLAGGGRARIGRDRSVAGWVGGVYGSSSGRGSNDQRRQRPRLRPARPADCRARYNQWKNHRAISDA